MKKSTSIFAILIIVCLGVLGSCDSKDTPLPPEQDQTEQPDEPENPDDDTLEPNQIPLIKEMPTEYTQSENLYYDTMPNPEYWGGGWLRALNPVIDIYDTDSSVPTAAYDDQIYVEMDGKKYVIGDIIKNPGYLSPRFDHPIGHIVDRDDIAQTPIEDIKGICLGTLYPQVDYHLTFNWPEKNLKLYLRLINLSGEIELPEGHVYNRKGEITGIGHATGMFVNGIGTRHLEIKVQPNGSVKVFATQKYFGQRYY